MKSSIRIMAVGVTSFCLLLGAARAGQSKVEILSDRQMSSVEGGFCPIEQCQPGAPTGLCQPIPDAYLDLCTPRVCTAELDQWLNIQVFTCVLAGQYTCSGTGGYRKCIPAIVDVCWNSSVNVCGDLVLPFCKPDLADKVCTCGVDFTSTPCDWTNCLLGGN